MTIKHVGLIGVGLMGHGIGKNILEKGYKLSVVAHHNRGPVDDLIARGATEAASAHALGKQCDMVLLCVTGSPEVEEAVYGEYGLLQAVREGFIIADCSTAEPDSTARIAKDVEAKGGWFIDTPMTRTPKEAAAGKLGLMIAGPENILAEVRPVLECFADTIVIAGAAVGAAHQLKLINNFVALGNAAIAAEAMTVAARAGVSMTALRDIVMAGGAASVMFGRLIHVPLAGDDSQAQFTISNARKDLRYYTAMTGQLPVTSFLAQTVHQTLVLADNLGYGHRFVPRLIDALMEVNGGKKKES